MAERSDISAEQLSGSRWLLVLPSPPSEISLNTLRVAYGPGLTAALHEAAEQASCAITPTKLDIGVAYNGCLGFQYSTLQDLFALLYKLSCMICTESKIDPAYDNDVDVLFFLFKHLSKGLEDQAASNDGRSLHLADLDSLSQNSMPWTRVCFLQDEISEGMLRHFLRSRKTTYDEGDSGPEVSRLPGGLSVAMANIPASPKSEVGKNAVSRHRSVAVGGTFDHLHAGHKLLLTLTALLCLSSEPATNQKSRPCLTIGITGDKLLNNKQYKDQLEDWHKRQASVRAFLADFLRLCSPDMVKGEARTVSAEESEGKRLVDSYGNFGLNIMYAEIFDPYGPTITDPAITALVISAETRAGAESVNKKRQEKGWSALEVYEVGVLDVEDKDRQDEGNSNTQDFQNKLSSTEIRSRIYQKNSLGT